MKLFGYDFKNKKNFFISCFVVFTLSCDVESKVLETSVMTFNVENLFDNVDDPGILDETYLSKQTKQTALHKQKCRLIKSYHHRKSCYELDWSDQAIAIKLKNIAATILSVEGGHGPDNLFLIEVENINILRLLNERYLKMATYKTVVLIQGTDPRGINIAFLSRYKMVGKSSLNSITFHPRNPKDKERVEKTRGVLDVKIQFPNTGIIRFLGVHFPSQGNPSYLREQAIVYLKKLIEKNKDQSIIIGGDFNVTSKEEQKKKYLTTQLLPLGQISHMDACADCEGSYWYKGHWSFLDILFFSKGLGLNNWTLIKESVQVLKNNPQHFDGKKPIRFDSKKLIGASDHLPVYARLKWNKD